MNALETFVFLSVLVVAIAGVVLAALAIVSVLRKDHL